VSDELGIEAVWPHDEEGFLLWGGGVLALDREEVTVW
jgi:hypothetical protein